MNSANLSIFNKMLVLFAAFGRAISWNIEIGEISK